MRLSKEGLKALHGSEGCRLKAYMDGGGVPTIGWGSTHMFGLPVKMGMTCTQEQADSQAYDDVEDVENCINKNVLVPLTQNQFDALVSLVYNIGSYAFTHSTLLRKLNSKDYKGAAGEFVKWKFDNGKEVEGLLNRRLREQQLFNT